MRIFLFFLLLAGVALAQRSEDNNHGDMRRWLTSNFYRTMKFVVWAKMHMSDIKTYINEYFDKITSGIEIWGNQTGLDNIPLNNVNQSFRNAYIKLWNGSLHGLEFINRSDDALIEYSHKEKKIVLTLPLVLDKIQFFYDYQVALLLIGPEGKMIGSVDKFKAYMNMTFDLTDYKFKINKLGNWGMGNITVQCEDTENSDIVASMLSDFAVEILHPQIEAVINEIINGIANKFVDTINEAIQNILDVDNKNNVLNSGNDFQKLFQSISNRNL